MTYSKGDFKEKLIAQVSRKLQLASFRLPDKRLQSNSNASSGSLGLAKRLRDKRHPDALNFAYKDKNGVSGSGRTKIVK